MRSEDFPIVNEGSIPVVERVSPKGRYHILRRDLSAALGAPKDAGPEGGGHPFAVEVCTILPGKENFPLHSHAAQWEFYFVRSGTGALILEDGERPIGPGDSFMCVPGVAHELRSDPDCSLVLLVAANNPMADLAHYPRTGKYGAKPGPHFFSQETNYYEGEE
jgi:uncharacterized cupin superfamily protein